MGLTRPVRPKERVNNSDILPHTAVAVDIVVRKRANLEQSPEWLARRVVGPAVVGPVEAGSEEAGSAGLDRPSVDRVNLGKVMWRNYPVVEGEG